MTAPDPANSDILDLPGHRIEVLRWGPTPPGAVLLPGASGGIRGYHRLGAELAARGISVLGMNPRGCGASTGSLDDLTFDDLARDVIGVIAATARPPVLLIGHAGGNRIARLVATLRPDLVRGLVLLAAGGDVPPDAETAAAMTALRTGAVTDPDARDRLIRQVYFAPVHPVADEFRHVPDRSPAFARAFTRAAQTADTAHWYGGGTGPVLVIQGVQDRVAPPANGYRLRDRYPDRVDLVDLTDAGHALCNEKPAEIAGLIAEFVARLAPGP